MRTVCLIGFLLFFASCRSQQSTVVKESDVMSLNGSWKFLASNEVDESELMKNEFERWDTIQVPGNWDTRERYSEYVGKGYYKKEFIIPTSWKNQQIRLKFDAVYETAKVWLNGNYLGEHVGGYTPFEFNNQVVHKDQTCA